MIHYEAPLLGEEYCRKLLIYIVNFSTEKNYAFLPLRFTISPRAITPIAPAAPAIKL